MRVVVYGVLLANRVFDRPKIVRGNSSPLLLGGRYDERERDVFLKLRSMQRSSFESILRLLEMLGFDRL